MKIRFTKNFFMILIFDVSLIILSFYLAYLLRFDFNISLSHWKTALGLIPIILSVKLMFFFFFDLYRGMWRYTSLNDLVNVLKAAFGSFVILVLFVLWWYRFDGIPRSIFLIDLCFTILFIAGLRVSARFVLELLSGRPTSLRELFFLFYDSFKKGKIKKRLLIIGAGDCGEKIYREIKDNAIISYKVLGFLDDDPLKLRRTIHGVSVIARVDDLEKTVLSTGVSEVIIAMPSVDAQRLREIIELCKKSNVKFKIVPGMGELINGKVTVKAIRDVQYRDLLGRKPVDLDKEKIGRYLSGKNILVTGAGGSIGSGLCKQIVKYSPDCIILFERAESPLYEIELELSRQFGHIKIYPCLGDVQDKFELAKVFEQFTPEIVFHAAAYKHVPMLELHPWKAVDNNICGTANLVETANKYGCEKFVFVSTDKAVNPVNVMGASKRVSEMIVQNFGITGKSSTHFITVRFGNVIGSVGSVIPMFKKQIKKGGPLTITHPEMIRYFMLIPEACQLILQAGSMGRGGEIFILEMGDPVKIDEMARDLIRFSGFTPDIDIKIKYIGLRPGEKLYEELMIDCEDVVPTCHESILVLNGRQYNMNKVNITINRLKDAAKQRDSDMIKSVLKEIVPEYYPSN